MKEIDGNIGLFLCCGQDETVNSSISTKWPILVDYQLMTRRRNTDDAVSRSVCIILFAISNTFRVCVCVYVIITDTGHISNGIWKRTCMGIIKIHDNSTLNNGLISQITTI